MICSSIEMQGFRTFRKPQKVMLPTAPGLYLVRGRNLVDTSLEGNDVGKSTLWSAMYWCFYGITDRGLKAGNIVSWGENQAQVAVDVKIGGTTHTLFRQQNPNRLLLDGEAATQETINDLLGYNSVEFLHSILIGQFTDYFMDLGPAEKLSLFSEVLGLGYWEDRVEQTRKKVADQEQIVADLVNRLAKEGGRVGALREQEKAMRKDKRAWESDHRKKSKSLSIVIGKLQRERLTVKEEHDQSFADTKKIELAVKDHHESLMTSRAELVPTSRQLAAIKSDLKHDRCPFCKRPLGSTWRQKLESEMNSVALEVKRIERAIKGGERLVADLRKKLLAAQEKTLDLRKQLDRIENHLSQAKKELAAEDRNPYAAPLEALRGDLARSRDNKRALTAKRDEAATAQARLSYWVHGFRDLRLWIMDSMLAELEMHCNNGLLQLGLDRWLIKLDIERENKSGGITKGFLVQIGQPGCDSIPQRALGGGVTQRLRLAAQAGISDLINSRKQCAATFEVWDEPSNWLSPRGVTDLLQHLQARSRQCRKAVFIVDHRSLDFAFDAELEITKNAGSSSISMR